MSRIRRKYSKDQKLEIVKLSLEEGTRIVDLAERFDISANAIYNWRSKYFKYNDSAFPGHGNKTMTEEEKEISRLKKELREAQLERDILKKAVSIFSKGGSKYSNL
jgi:transposase